MLPDRLTLPDDRCPICHSAAATQHPVREDGLQRIECTNCGDHLFTLNALRVAETGLADGAARAIVAHGVHKRPRGDRIDARQLQDLARVTTLPPATERVDLLVLHLADAAPPGERIDLDPYDLVATLGTANASQARWVIGQALALGWVDSAMPLDYGDAAPVHRAALTVQGWQHQAALLQRGAGSRHAFMAMVFNDPELTALFEQHLKPAVAATGFDLRTTEHERKTAGLIDHRMRVEIRTSRFVVCDLTHHNRGAYWEAGFAEGIGRPVFFTCRRDVAEHADAAQRPHFDTAHQLIVRWDAADPAPAMRELQDVIRATLPDEAWMDNPAVGRGIIGR